MLVAAALVLSGCHAYFWGDNSTYQYGNGTTASSSTPVQVGFGDFVYDGAGVAADAGGLHACALKTHTIYVNDPLGFPQPVDVNSAYCWGDNTWGQVDRWQGLGSAPFSYDSPELVSLEASAVSAGARHTCVIETADVRPNWLLCIGDNRAGQLGIGAASAPDPNRNDMPWGWPIRGSDFGLDGGVVAVTTGDHHTCAINSAGQLWCWGGNTYGEVGDGTTTERDAPVLIVASAFDWLHVSAGDYHTCGIRADHSLWCWGRNTWGQLGIGTSGTSTSQHSPVRVGTATDWQTVEAGNRHTCGIRAGGQMWCWGNNTYGEVGDGTTVQRTSPVRVGTAGDWSVLGTIEDLHTCAIRGGVLGTLWCWGWNGQGTPGDPTTTRFTPTQVGTATNWSNVSTGSNFTFGLTS
jgi:alpha-tubulin suppressor-like RCC1 family protein